MRLFNGRSDLYRPKMILSVKQEKNPDARVRLIGLATISIFLILSNCIVTQAQTINSPNGNAIGHDNNGQMIVINPPKQAPATTIEATYKVCIAGEPERCPAGTVFIRCYGGKQIADWAAKECSTYTQAVLHREAGGVCG